MKSSVEQIKEKLSILDVVGSYVELHRAGKSYKGKSPFTNEKTPSFYVSPDRGMYYCFSSNQGGDMFTFIQAIEGVDFKGALKILAEKAGVELITESPEKKNERDRAYQILEDATLYFFEQGRNTPHVKEYLASRGVTAETIHAWRVGFAPDAWRSLRTHLRENGYTDTEIFSVGLLKDAGSGKEPYDVFRNRVMFPICDPSGRVVAFSGRTLSSDSKSPKYVNSPETELFKKSDIMFGYHLAKNGIRHYDFSLIVEGQFDVVLAHQAGYVNAVAVSGTAFTAHHIELLSRLSSRAVLCLDSDRAGIEATKRAAVPMLERGMDVKVAKMTGGKDPAEIVRDDPAQLKKAIGGALAVILWLLDVLKENAKDERAYKLIARNEVIPLIASIPDAIDREHFEGEVAEAISTTREAVHLEVARVIRDREKRETPLSTRNQGEGAYGVRFSLQENVRVRDELREFFLFSHTLLTILSTESKKCRMYERIGEIVSLIHDELSQFGQTLEVPTSHEINEYIASRTREIKHDFEEIERTEPIKIQAIRIASAMTRFHQYVIVRHIAREHILLRDAEKEGNTTETIQHTITELHRRKPKYEADEFI